MEMMQELDHKFNQAKIVFQTEMENDYLQMSDKLLLQCKELVKEKEFIEKSKKGGHSKLVSRRTRVSLFAKLSFCNR